jgi:hypothetical protein
MNFIKTLNGEINKDTPYLDNETGWEVYARVTGM